jgi:hypothetical protein
MTSRVNEWEELAARLLKVEMARAKVKPGALAQRLAEMGLPESEPSVEAQIRTGSFPAWFFLASLRAIGIATLRLE